MCNADKKERVGSALLDLTERGTLSWEKVSGGADELPENLASWEGSVYAAVHGDTDLYLYKPEISGPEADSGAKSPVLEVYDPERKASWTYPKLDTLEALYDLVECRTSGLRN